MRVFVCAALLLAACHRNRGPVPSTCADGWSQWGLGGSHSGTACATAQPMTQATVDLTYDPFVDLERADADGDLLGHFQSTLLAGDDVFMEFKAGNYVGVNAWDQQIWSERKYTWKNGALELQWRVDTDWKPPPDAGHLGGWEPVFHGALGPQDLWLPCKGGAVMQVARDTGAVRREVDPFAGDPHTYVAGPITVDAGGNAIWTVIRFGTANANPWAALDTKGALVRAAPDGSFVVVPTDTLIPNAPTICEAAYQYDRRNPPPLPLVDAQGNIQAPPQVTCGAQRPALNVAPAAAPDGSVYFVTRAHRADRHSYLVALNPDLSLKWAASWRDIVNDGCGITFACRPGVPAGIDPDTGRQPAMRVIDESTASPVVLPDGAVAVGTYSGYNGARGHLLRFSADGKPAGVFDFGWDTTPAFFTHDGTYSIVLKDNHYETSGPYFITQLNADLSRIEWQYQSTNFLSCARRPDGHLECADDHQHPNGFEWCVNAIAIDGHGVVYANSEDGNLYAIYQGGEEKQRLFLNLALGAAYTPLSIDAKGRIYTQNAGHLYVVGQ